MHTARVVALSSLAMLGACKTSEVVLASPDLASTVLDMATPATADGVACLGTRCAPGMWCCQTGDYYTCASPDDPLCTSMYSFACDGPEDCAAGELCAASSPALDPPAPPYQTRCLPAASDPGTGRACHDAADCTQGLSCQPAPYGFQQIITLLCAPPHRGYPGEVRCEPSSVGALCDVKDAAQRVCCPFDTSWICAEPGVCAAPRYIACDEASDCGDGQDCCVAYDFSGGEITSASCAPAGYCPSSKACIEQSDCGPGTVCTPLPNRPWMSTCQPM